MSNLSIIPFEAQYAKAFYTLNIEWLDTYFYVEPFDEEVLSKPQTCIINHQYPISIFKSGIYLLDYPL